MTEDEIIDCIRNVKKQRSGGMETPHKPLLLLLALKRYEQGERELSFETVDRDLSRVLREFRTHSSPVHPHYPFWHLQYDCKGRLWEVDLPHRDKMRHDTIGPGRRRPREDDLRKHGGTGRLRSEVLEALDRNRHLCARLVGVILDHHIPEPFHAPVLKALGMGLGDILPLAPPKTGMTEDEIIDCVRSIRKQRGTGMETPHKPLLLLLALKCYEQGERELPFDMVDRELDWLLQEFRTHSSPVHPHYPFWHLQYDCKGRLWEVDLPHRDKMRFDTVGPRRRRPHKADLRKYGGIGRLRPEVLDALDRNRRLCARLVGIILDHHIPEPLHARVLEALGIGLGESGGETGDATAPRPIDFRREVLLAYNSRCAICDFTVTMENSLIGLEAAHIRWKSSEGPDIVTNGLALCANHHRMFDRGVFSLAGPEDDYSILIARNAQFAGGLEEARQTARGMHFSLPLREQDNPSADYLAWHRENVFERRRQRTSPTP